MRVLSALLLVVVVAGTGWSRGSVAAEETEDWAGEDFSDEEEESAPYDPDSQGADHTAFAIAFENDGDFDQAGRAFTAAMRHNKNANTLLNLGVFMMRRRKFTGPGEALDSMWQAKTRYRTPESAPLINENWAGLMQTMKALNVRVPEKYRDHSVAVLGDLPSFMDDDDEWQIWFDGDETADELIAHGIQKDRDGDVLNAGRAFLAAVRTKTEANTLVNLGVFMMRRRNFPEALLALHAARVTYRSTALPDKLSHIDANWCGRTPHTAHRTPHTAHRTVSALPRQDSAATHHSAVHPVPPPPPPLSELAD